MTGARTIVIKTRAGTLFDMVCDNPAAQSSEQIGVNNNQAVHNHWLLPGPPPWPDTELANNNASSAGAKNSTNRIVPPQAWDTLNPPDSTTCLSHSFSLHAARESASAAWRGTGVATGNASDRFVPAPKPNAASRGTIKPPSHDGHRIWYSQYASSHAMC